MADRIAQLRRMLEAEPNDGFCLYALAQELGRSGRHEEAIRHYDLAIVADPAACHAFYHKAKCLADVGRASEAAQTLRLGITRAREVGDGHAASEMAALLDELTP